LPQFQFQVSFPLMFSFDVWMLLATKWRVKYERDWFSISPSNATRF
jgi:hypothetical protein